MATPEERYKKIADRLNELIQGREERFLSPRQAMLVEQGLRDRGESARAPKKTPVITPEEVSIWAGELGDYIIEALISRGHDDTLALRSTVWTEILDGLMTLREDIDPISGERTATAWGQATTNAALAFAGPVVRFARIAVFDENQSGLAFPDTITFEQRTIALARSLPAHIATTAFRNAVTGRGGDDVASSFAAQQWMASMEQLDENGSTPLRENLKGSWKPLQEAGRLNERSPRPGILVSQAGSLFETFEDADVAAGTTPFGSLPGLEPERRGTGRDRAIAKATKRPGEFLTDEEALAIANFLLGDAGEQHFTRKTFIDAVVQQGRTEAEGIREWNAFDVARQNLVQSILSTSRDVDPGLGLEEAAAVVVDAAEAEVVGFNQAETASLEAHVRAEKAKETAAAEKKLADEGVTPTMVKAAVLTATDSEVTVDQLGKTQLAAIRVKISSGEWDAMSKVERNKFVLEAAIATFRGEQFKKQEEISTEAAAGKKAVADMLFEVSNGAIGPEDLLEEDWLTVLNMVQAGKRPARSMLDAAVARKETADLAEEAATTAEAEDVTRGRLNVAAISPWEVERLLEDAGIGKVGSTSLFQRQIRSIVVPQLVEALEDVRKADPTAQIDFLAHVREFVQGGQFEGFVDEEAHRTAVARGDRVPGVPPEMQVEEPVPGIPLEDIFPDQPGPPTPPGEEGFPGSPELGVSTVPKGMEAVPTLETAGQIRAETLTRAGRPVVPEGQELEAIISGVAEEDPFFQQYLLQNIESILGDVEKAGLEDLRVRKEEDFATALALREKYPDRFPVGTAKRFVGRELSRVKFEPLFEKQIPALRERFEQTPAFLQRRQREEDKVEAQAEQDRLRGQDEAEQRHQRSLRRRGRTVFAGLR